MQDYEKLGIFYLGREYDLDSEKQSDQPVLYKSKDLTTHAAIIGMTGSGKTGLGISLIEEAALDNIPVIAIDPKGDMANLALTFPQLRGEDFLPWINPTEAATKGLSPEEYAQQQAVFWKDQLSSWDQPPERIQKLKDAAEVRIYTPGGSAGIPVSLLQSFAAPPTSVQVDSEAFREKILVTATSLLTLVGWNGDPFTSREHILVSSILESSWSQGKSLSMAEMIGALQNPPMERIGVMDMESFFPSKERFGLAMLFNNLLASPSFKVWMEGEPLQIDRFFYNENGKPRVSVFSIAHLSDKERMFFVTMLLNELISWMRSQSGTGSLRALLYMDELFGYLPPTANPPSKTPLLTLLKQARAFGLGLVLSTQNPVDLDYKAMSNMGTWFIGRLQTEQDKERVISGLEGASAGGGFNRKEIEKILSGLGKRIFYLHTVHEDQPVIFTTRFALSYLAGPLTREQIASLPKGTERSVSGSGEGTASVPARGESAGASFGDMSSDAPPILDPKIQQVYLPGVGVSANPAYRPVILGMAEIMYSNAKYGINTSERIALTTDILDGPVPVDWNLSDPMDLAPEAVDKGPMEGIPFLPLPSAAALAKNYGIWEKLFLQYLRTNRNLELLRSPSLKEISAVGEEERDFRIRLQHLAHEKRDDEVEQLKKKYEAKFQALESRLMRARQTMENRSTQANQKKMEAAVSAGTAILGALFGKKAISATSISKVGTAVKSTTRAMKSGEAIAQSKETLETLEAQMTQLELELEQEIAKLTEKYEISQEELEKVMIRPAAGGIALQLFALGWILE